jgi:hypothetical protein
MALGISNPVIGGIVRSAYKSRRAAKAASLSEIRQRSFPRLSGLLRGSEDRIERTGMGALLELDLSKLDASGASARERQSTAVVDKSVSKPRLRSPTECGILIFLESA